MCDMIQLIAPKAARKIKEDYYFATIHRPYNTDDDKRILAILNIFNSLDKKSFFLFIQEP